MDRRVQIVIDLMKKNLQAAPSFEDLAVVLNISPSRLRYLFKTQVGMSPSNYLKHLRMQKARELAETTLLRAKQVMNMLGITDQSHFTRDFKRAHGMTFTQYRECFGNLPTLPGGMERQPGWLGNVTIAGA